MCQKWFGQQMKAMYPGLALTAQDKLILEPVRDFIHRFGEQFLHSTSLSR
jgi:hypothetical protein